jgi:D-glycero-alpha-D-manno-heptose-7-phosphate kinase
MPAAPTWSSRICSQPPAGCADLAHAAQGEFRRRRQRRRLVRVVADSPVVVESLGNLRDAARALFRELAGGASLDVLGTAMHESWQTKRALPGVTDSEIDGWYDTALRAGATGGKLLGSGSGGFLLLYAPAERQADVRRALGELREFAFAPESEGTRIIYVGR